MNTDYTPYLEAIINKLEEQSQSLMQINQYQIYLLFAIGLLCGLFIVRLLRW